MSLFYRTVLDQRTESTYYVMSPGTPTRVWLLRPPSPIPSPIPIPSPLGLTYCYPRYAFCPVQSIRQGHHAGPAQGIAAHRHAAHARAGAPSVFHAAGADGLNQAARPVCQSASQATSPPAHGD